MAPRPSSPEDFWQASDSYHGVIVSDGAMRLSVSPNGKRYLLQVNENGDWSRVVRWRKSLALLQPDVPNTLRAMMPDGLPDDPRDYRRPWADEVDALRERMARASPLSARYAGVIESGEGWRLVWVLQPAYAVQVPKGKGWTNAAIGEDRAALRASMSRQSDAVPVLVDPAIHAALERCEDAAADYPAPVIERFRDVQAGVKRRGGQAKPPPQKAQRRRTGPQSATEGRKAATGPEGPEKAQSAHKAPSAPQRRAEPDPGPPEGEAPKRAKPSRKARRAAQSAARKANVARRAKGRKRA